MARRGCRDWISDDTGLFGRLRPVIAPDSMSLRAHQPVPRGCEESVRTTFGPEA